MATNMSNNKWETVTRKKNATAAEKKAARKGLAESTPTIDIARKCWTRFCFCPFIGVKLTTICVVLQLLAFRYIEHSMLKHMCFSIE